MTGRNAEESHLLKDAFSLPGADDRLSQLGECVSTDSLVTWLGD